jgi:hypothetical protein
VRRFVLVAFLLALVGCQAGTTDEPATPTTVRMPASTIAVDTGVVVVGPPTTLASSVGDGICSHEERGSHSADCDQASPSTRN